MNVYLLFLRFSSLHCWLLVLGIQGMGCAAIKNSTRAHQGHDRLQNVEKDFHSLLVTLAAHHVELTKCSQDQYEARYTETLKTKKDKRTALRSINHCMKSLRKFNDQLNNDQLFMYSFSEIRSEIRKYQDELEKLKKDIGKNLYEELFDSLLVTLAAHRVEFERYGQDQYEARYTEILKTEEDKKTALQSINDCMQYVQDFITQLQNFKLFGYFFDEIHSCQDELEKLKKDTGEKIHEENLYEERFDSLLVTLATHHVELTKCSQDQYEARYTETLETAEDKITALRSINHCIKSLRKFNDQLFMYSFSEIRSEISKCQDELKKLKKNIGSKLYEERFDSLLVTLAAHHVELTKCGQDQYEARYTKKIKTKKDKNMALQSIDGCMQYVQDFITQLQNFKLLEYFSDEIHSCQDELEKLKKDIREKLDKDVFEIREKEIVKKLYEEQFDKLLDRLADQYHVKIKCRNLIKFLRHDENQYEARYTETLKTEEDKIRAFQSIEGCMQYVQDFITQLQNLELFGYFPDKIRSKMHRKISRCQNALKKLYEKIAFQKTFFGNNVDNIRSKKMRLCNLLEININDLDKEVDKKQEELVKKCRRKIALQYHSDKHRGDIEKTMKEKEEIMKEINALISELYDK